MMLHELDKPLSLIEIIRRGLTPEEKELYCVTQKKVRRTLGIFQDFACRREIDYPNVFTLTDCRPLHYKILEDGSIYYDMRQLYLGVDDLTEFKFVERFLYDKVQWERIQKSWELSPIIEEWRTEQRLKVKSDMFNVLLDDANDRASKTRTQSAKYLLEKYYDPKSPTTRQTKKEKDQDNKLLLADKERILESFKLN